MTRANLSLVVICALAGCGGGTTDGPRRSAPAAPAHVPAPAPEASAPGAATCRDGERSPCGCAAGKGYQVCKGGAFGKCVCSRGRTSLAVRPAIPSRTSQAPSGALTTPLGVPFVVLRSGSGSRRPAGNDRVVVHYEMWDGTGKKTDSSRKRGRPATFPLRAVIPGFSDVMKTMVVGQMVRCWIPPRLGYKNRPGRPQGTLVFEIELLGIH